jgi:hypothetical protein
MLRGVAVSIEEPCQEGPVPWEVSAGCLSPRREFCSVDVQMGIPSREVMTKHPQHTRLLKVFEPNFSQRG